MSNINIGQRSRFRRRLLQFRNSGLPFCLGFILLVVGGKIPARTFPFPSRLPGTDLGKSVFESLPPGYPGYLPMLGSTPLRFLDPVEIFDRMLLHGLSSESKSSGVDQELIEEPTSTVESPAEIMEQDAPAPEMEPVDEPKVPETLPIGQTQSETASAVNFIDPEDLLIFFEKESADEEGSKSVGIPFQVPYQSPPKMGAGTSSAVYEQK